jgi:sucrose-phosphate synthase
MQPPDNKLYILLISVHGLIRGHHLELGCDADTGGQTKYVVELAHALGKHPDVGRVDLLTRSIFDEKISDDYSEEIEEISDKVRIVRIECGDELYIPKEQLWDHLDSFADNALSYLHVDEEMPHIIHSHYADAGYVGTQLSHQLSIPLIHTGHSLGRTKRKSLLASGVRSAEIEVRYNMSRRIEAEENTLGIAERVITSTHQEIKKQYGLYDYYQPNQMRVIPPGTDLEKFFPPQGSEKTSNIAKQINRFLQQPDKPIILALSRPDHRKNIITLIEAYGESEELQQIANLVIIAGNRDDIKDMDSSGQEVLNDILLAIDQHDLYGRIAYPKHHDSEEVPVIYRLAALTEGTFVNPALIEPFGLTLIEAAASGLPIAATEDGGPTDIIENCHNGYLFDPLDKNAITEALIKILSDKKKWQKLSDKGIKGVRKHYSWQAHAEKYIDMAKPIINKTEPLARMCLHRRPMLYHNRAIFSDLDQSLLGDKKSLDILVRTIKDNNKCSSFGIATGRRLDAILKLLKQNDIPQPNVLITSLGTEIYYAPNLTKDIAWDDHIDYLWKPRKIRATLKELPGLKLQPKIEQSKFKVSYYYDPELAPNIEEINHLLLQHDITVHVVFSFGQFLDIVPIRASKGLAVRWYAEQWDIPLENILAAGGSGADEDMLRGNTLAVIVANRHDEELTELIDHKLERIYFAKSAYAAGILEAIDHYDFFNTCEAPS